MAQSEQLLTYHLWSSEISKGLEDRVTTVVDHYGGHEEKRDLRVVFSPLNYAGELKERKG